MTEHRLVGLAETAASYVLMFVASARD